MDVIGICDTMPAMNAQIFARAKRFLHGAGASAVDIAMPPLCPQTGEPLQTPASLSAAAWRELSFIDAPLCDHCGVPFAADYGADLLCPSCIADPPAFRLARAAIVYDDASHKLVVGFKHSDRVENASMFAAWMVRAGADLLSSETHLVPAPLHPRRLLARRFNQSALLARAVAAASGAQFTPDLLRRIRATPPQKALSAKARERNVAGAFRINVRRRREIEGARIVLIDDVLTTGATLSACAKPLLRAGAASVDALVLARVVKGGVGAL